MKLILTFVLIGSFCVMGYASENDPAGDIGVGFQATYPNIGMSVRYNLNRVLGLQATVGAFGDVITAGMRANFIHRRANHNAVFYGAFGTFQYESQPDPYLMYYKSSTNSVGVGFGLEWFIRKLPELGLELDVGFFHKWDTFSNRTSDRSTHMTVGAAAHYYFR